MKNTLLFIAATLAFAGCSKSEAGETTAEEPTEETTGGETSTVAPSAYQINVVGDHLEIPEKIQFDTGSDAILEASYPLLDAIAQTIRENPEIRRVKVVGHTDITGAVRDNQDLSLRRARSVVEYLVTNAGLSIDLEAYGLGEDEPLCEERTDECNTMNRRVEFIILDAQ